MHELKVGNRIIPSLPHTQVHWQWKRVSDQTVAWKKWGRGWCLVLPLDFHFEAFCVGFLFLHSNRVLTPEATWATKVTSCHSFFNVHWRRGATRSDQQRERRNFSDTISATWCERRKLTDALCKWAAARPRQQPIGGWSGFWRRKEAEVPAELPQCWICY